MNDSPSDETLLASWLLGESAAFEIFFRRHSVRVAAYATRKGIHKDEVPEVVQDVYLKLHNHIHQFEVGKKALPWFFTVVHHTCLDHLKRGGKAKAQHPMAADVDLESVPMVPQQEEDALSPDLSGALSHLSTEHQKILDMRLVEELSFHEISRRTGKTETSLRKTYSRSLQSLRDWIGVPRGKKR